MRKVDLAILGGGCAGLSLARELALAGQKRGRVPATVVLEGEDACATSKTWCWWRRSGDHRGVPASARWQEWTFSAAGRRVRHATEVFEYACLRGEGFFADALKTIDGCPETEVRTGAAVHEVEELRDGFRVSSAGGDILCHALVDTRPPPRSVVGKSRMFQCFSGVEISLREGAMKGSPVGLMESMQADERGFIFDYHLPMGPDRMLVEATRFSRRPLSRSVLEADLQASLRRLGIPALPEVHRQEFGVIPMGLPRIRQPDHKRWVFAGTRGGAVRAASGYAFAGIQEWSRRCAAALMASGNPVPPKEPSPLVRSMDELFLSVLTRHPEQAPGLFLAMADGLSAEAFVRFMTDSARPGDLLRVIRSLPARPFLSELFRQLPNPWKRTVLPVS